MGQSSGCFECRLKGRSGVDDGPEDVHASAGECDDGLMVSLSFAALAFVEGAAVIVGEGAKGGLVEDPLESLVAATGTSEEAGSAGRHCCHRRHCRN